MLESLERVLLLRLASCLCSLLKSPRACSLNRCLMHQVFILINKVMIEIFCSCVEVSSKKYLTERIVWNEIHKRLEGGDVIFPSSFSSCFVSRVFCGIVNIYDSKRFTIWIWVRLRFDSLDVLAASVQIFEVLCNASVDSNAQSAWSRPFS